MKFENATLIPGSPVEPESHLRTEHIKRHAMSDLKHKTEKQEVKQQPNKSNHLLIKAKHPHLLQQTTSFIYIPELSVWPPLCVCYFRTKAHRILGLLSVPPAQRRVKANVTRAWRTHLSLKQQSNRTYIILHLLHLPDNRRTFKGSKHRWTGEK